VHTPGQLIILQELSLTHASTFHARQRGIPLTAGAVRTAQAPSTAMLTA